MGIIILCICLQMPVIIGLINSQHNVMFVNANKDVHEKHFWGIRGKLVASELCIIFLIKKP